MTDSPYSPQQNPQIQQDIKGDRNQTIGQVLGGLVVYGQVIYNNPPILDVSAAKTPVSEIGPNPYKGLLAFHETDGDRFFGRNREIHDLWERFRSLHEDDSKIRLLTIYGPSGSGKSSLARAGLIPELARRPIPGCDRARVAVLVPGSHPLETLATVLARIATNDPMPVAKTREFATELKQANAEGEYDGLRRIGDALPNIAISPLIVLVDQLEEVFTLCEDLAEREVFIANLLWSAGDRSNRVSVIATFRSDFLGATQKHPKLNQWIATQGYLVAAMGAKELREAIAKPAELAGRPLDGATIGLLIEQTEGREGALPLLQFALSRIWAGLAEGKEAAQTLEEIGGVGGALAGEAQRIYDGLDDAEQDIARRVFLGLLQLGEGTKYTRHRIEIERIVSHCDSLMQVQQVIARFSDPGNRLITLAGEEGSKTAEVTHDAVVDHWNQMQEWLDTSRSDLRFQRHLDEVVMMWAENGRPEGSLWRSPDLDLLRNFHDRSGDDMTTLQVEFFNASDKAEVSRQQAKQKQIQREKDLAAAKLKAAEDREIKVQKDLVEEAAKRVKTQKRLTAALGISLVLTLGATVVAASQVQQSQRQWVEELAANTQVLLASQPSDALVNAIVATGISQSVFVRFPNLTQSEVVEESLINAIRENSERNRLIHESYVTSVAFSPDDKRIVSGSGYGTVRLWDANSGKPIGQPFKGHEKDLDVSSVAFSPDGNRIVSGSFDNTVRLWDANSGKPIGQPFKGHENYVTSVAFSPDGKRIVSGSFDNTVRLWDANSGKPIGQPFKGHENYVTSVAFSPDNKRIVSGSFDNTVRLWDANSGKPIGQPFKGHENYVTSVAFSPDGKRIVSGGGDGTMHLWDANSGKPIGHLFKGHESDITSIAFSPDGNRIVSGSRDNTVRLWDANSGKPIGQPFKGHEAYVTSVAFSPNGTRIVSGSVDNTVRLWDATGQSFRQAFKGHEDYVYSVAFSPNGNRIVSGSRDNTVRLWDANSGKPIGQPFKGHEKDIISVAFSPDGNRIVSGSGDNTMRLWDANSGKLIGKPFKGHEDYVNSVAFSPDSNRIVSGSWDKTVRLWDANSGKPIGQPFKGHEAYVTSVAFSPDGKHIVSGSGDDTMRLWDANSGKLIGKPFKGHENDITSIAFSPDGKRIVSGSFDNTMRLWDANSGKPIGKPFKGHENDINSVAFSPDGNHIVSGSFDNTVRIWDANSGKPIGKPFKGHEAYVNSVAFSPDGKRIVSGGWDKTIRFWNIKWTHPLKFACSQLRYHPSLLQPTSKVAKEAKQICNPYTWKS